jgi:hypothetical protein
MKAAEATATMRAIHRHQHPLTVVPLMFAGQHWNVDFYYQRRLLAEAEVSKTGRATGVFTGPIARAVYARGHFSAVFDSPWVVVPFSLLFLLPFLDLRRLWRLATLDALVLLCLLISYGLFDHLHLVAAVWLVYPPLLYLGARMAWIGFGRGHGGGASAPLLPTRVLGIGLLLLVGTRVALGLLSNDVSDVGTTSAIGAHRLLSGLPLYYAASGHADTYGPVAYLAYAPFDLLFSLHGMWAARAAAIAFDLATIGGLVVLGTRLRPGREGRRLGLLLGWGWAACPFTLLALIMHTNDALVAMLLVLALVAFASPAARGALLGLAAAAKFSPAALLPLFASPRDRGWSSTLKCAGIFTLVVVTAIGFALPSGGLREFYDHTIGYQLGRTDVFSPWALHPGLKPVATAIEVGVVLLAAAIALVPRRRTVVQVSALAAMVTIGVQLPAIHWFYYYILWFLPFMLVAMLGAPQPAAEQVDRDGAEITVWGPQEQVLIPA